MDLYKCSDCSELKHGSEFYRANNTKRGYTYKCKACQRAHHTKVYGKVKGARPTAFKFAQERQGAEVTAAERDQLREDIARMTEEYYERVQSN